MPPRVAILGGGISGLSTAYFLKRLLPYSAEITLLESSDHPGGYIRTTNPNDFLFETGPRGFRPSRNGRAVLEMIEDLGLADQVCASSREAAARYIFMNGQVEKMPSSISEFLRFPMAPVLLRALIKEPFVAKGKVWWPFAVETHDAR